MFVHNGYANQYVQFLQVFMKVFVQMEFVDYHQIYWKGFL